MGKITDHLEVINQKIEEAKLRAQSTQNVNVIAVTKQVSIERTIEAIEAGLVHLGENRPEGLLSKKSNIQLPVKWHYIGSLQTRKVKQVINEIDYLHSLDRYSLAEEINKRAKNPIYCFVQANLSGEESKHGLSKDEVIPFIQSLQIFEKIRVVGLMTMAPNTEDKEMIRTVFRELKKLQQDVVEMNLPFAPCQELSMGMSNDFEIAVEEGATFVRIGTALVG